MFIANAGWPESPRAMEQPAQPANSARAARARRRAAAPAVFVRAGAGGGAFRCFVLLHIADWLAPFFVYHYFTGDRGDSIPLAVLYSLATFVLAQFGNFGIAIAGKWLAAGRLQAGPLSAVGRRLISAGGWRTNSANCRMSSCWPARRGCRLYLRALGARIGRDVMIDTITLGAPELLTVEDGVSIGTFVNIENARVEGGMLIIGPVHLERESVGGFLCGAGKRHGARRAGAAGRAIRAGGRAGKFPTAKSGKARRRGASDQSAETLPPRPQVGFARRWAQALFFAVTAIAVSVLFFLPTFPGVHAD